MPPKGRMKRKKSVAIFTVCLLLFGGSFIIVGNTGVQHISSSFSQISTNSQDYNDSAPLLTYFHDDFETNFSKNWEAYDDEPLSGYDYWGISGYRKENGN